jgi:hypothetical protein
MLPYLIVGLLTLTLAAGYHIALRLAPAVPAGAHERGHARSEPDLDLAGALETVRALARTVDRQATGDVGVRAALLLAAVVRAKQPGDEFACSRGLIDALDDAAAYLQTTMHGDPNLSDREVNQLAEMLAEPPRGWWPPGLDWEADREPVFTLGVEMATAGTALPDPEGDMR